MWCSQGVIHLSTDHARLCCNVCYWGSLGFGGSMVTNNDMYLPSAYHQGTTVSLAGAPPAEPQFESALSRASFE